MTKTLSQRCPVWRAWGQFAYIFNLQTEIEMKEFYDAIICDQSYHLQYLRILWASVSCFLCLFLVSDSWVKPIWTCPLQVDDRSGNSWAVGGICCGKTRVNLWAWFKDPLGLILFPSWYGFPFVSQMQRFYNIHIFQHFTARSWSPWGLARQDWFFEVMILVESLR